MTEYVGSARCKECHPQRFERWSHDWHARALSPARSEYVVGRYGNVHYKGDSSEAWMRRDSNGYAMRTLTRKSGFDDFSIRWVIGGKRMQDAVTEFGDGRWQVLPVYYHVTGRGEWVDYNESRQGRVGPDHPFFWTNFRRNANHECLDCHTTGLKVRYDRRAHQFTTEFADAGVACEDCHGPGARHAATEEPGDIVNPRRLDPAAQLGVCAQCHGPRNPLFPLFDAEHRYRPGQRYDDSYQPLVVMNGREHSGDFFADGRPKTSSFEYQALLQSRCYLSGGVTCLTCHTAPHDASAADELRLPPATAAASAPHTAASKPSRAIADVEDASCGKCHAAIVAAGQAHSRHRSAGPNRCVACHMPKVISGVLDQFADHALDVPVPANTERHGIPNACGVCHTKESAASLGRSLVRLWPNAAERQQRRIRLADAFDERTAAASLPALQAVIADEREAPSLRGAAAALLTLRFPSSAADVVPLLGAKDPQLRAKAVEALSFAGARSAHVPLAELLGDPSLMVRHAAAIVVAGLGDERGVSALERMAADPATRTLAQPHWILGQIYARRGDLDRAAAELERTLDLLPYFSSALVLLADVHIQRSNVALARGYLEDAVRFDPQHRGALDRLRLLNENHPPPGP